MNEEFKNHKPDTKEKLSGIKPAKNSNSGSPSGEFKFIDENV